MTTQAQNSLLLTLEEPPSHVVFILLTSDSGALLETIRSRAHILKTEILSAPLILENLFKKRTEGLISERDDEKLKIAASAAEQSGRGCIPEVLVLPSFQAALEQGAKADLPMIFYENEHSTTLKMALSSMEYKSVSLLTGPEGGLEEKEVAQAREAGLQVCTLGKRILRCETAPLCALSAVMYDAGEF